MPSSSNRGKIYTLNQIKKIIKLIEVNTVLDIGVGEGTYINKYKHLLSNSVWTGIEVWKKYIEKYNLTNKYDTIINKDIRTIDFSKLGQQDITFAGDVLEHMTKEESIKVVDDILNISKCLIVSIPVVHMPQDEYEGNPYEKHVKDDWSDKKFKDTFKDYIINSTVDEEIGVYILSKNTEFIKLYKKLKIAIYTICKNEEQFVDRWANSNKHSDLRIVCDTGSTDNTVEKLKQHGVTVYSITVSPWRFDHARNTALNLLPQDIDVCIWQDLDEELSENWYEQIQNNWRHDATIMNHRYRHNDGPLQWHSKIHKRHDCIWTGPVHETLKWFVPEKQLWNEHILLDEHQDTSKNRKSYKHLIEKKIKEGDHNWRTYYFLANEYYDDQHKSIETRIKSYEECKEGEIILSYIARNIAKGFASLNDHKNAMKWFNIAVNHGNERESWFSLAQYAYNKKDWEQCFLASKKCINVQTKRDGFTYDPQAWGFLIYDYAALSCYNLGLKSKAYEYGKIALDLNPNDERLKKNLKFYEES